MTEQKKELVHHHHTPTAHIEVWQGDGFLELHIYDAEDSELHVRLTPAEARWLSNALWIERLR